MRAKTFIEYFSEIKLTNIDIQGQDRKILDMIKIASVFYSRPFKPEDITEFFEKVITSINNEMPILQFREYIEWEYSMVGKRNTAKTINDFISDAKRADMELFWKEEIVKQYFK